MNSSTAALVKMAVHYSKYSLDQNDNLLQIPELKAVFGVFAVVDEEPVNCRFIGYSENLRREIKDLFDNPPTAAMRQFMQGAWIPMLVYQLVADSAEAEASINTVVNAWRAKYKPAILEDGTYPGYYDL